MGDVGGGDVCEGGAACDKSKYATVTEPNVTRVHRC